MKQPLIGLTSNTLREIPEAVKMGLGIPGQNWQLLADDYIRMIERSGGIPVILPVIEDPEKALPLWEMLDGILITGGNDINPILYKERIGKKTGHIDNKRDRYEMALAKYGVKNNIPILGVCRGLQILNVTLGGTLYQDLPTSGFELHTILTNPRNEGTHYVKVEGDSPLSKIVGNDDLLVNSFHHQAVKELAPSLKKMATSEDGVIEAAYMPESSFTMAFQWHPEMMYDNEIQQRIGKAFIEACLEI
ncbi:MAG: gamma-glutamyl-gamma-aminobutyrate hydrolase family protein [Tissierellaceae bacterium]|nr:gamma-glutamyl-gamma-aminobutyrate hydrolase family protein [Tissierellaceae bacterium]